MKILVTGASGMVGRHLLADSRAAEHEILRPGRGELDLMLAGATLGYIDRHRPELIIHLAALVEGIQANIDAPARFLSDNLTIGLNVVNAAREVEVPRLINLGSSCMYPTGLAEPLTVDRLLSGPLEPTNEGYALAKLAVWKLTQIIDRDSANLEYRTLVATNLYGPYDHFDPVRSHLVPAAILKIETARRAGLGEVEIWGDGTARREFLFAGDFADFLWRAHDGLGEFPATMNVGVGEDASVNDYYQAVADAVGWTGAFTHDLTRPVGMRGKRLDVSAQERLGWRPRTSLADGLAATVAYFRSVRP